MSVDNPFIDDPRSRSIHEESSSSSTYQSSSSSTVQPITRDAVRCNKRYLCKEEKCYHYNAHWYEKSCDNSCSILQDMGYVGSDRITDCIIEVEDFLKEEDMEL